MSKYFSTSSSIPHEEILSQNIFEPINTVIPESESSFNKQTNNIIIDDTIPEKTVLTKVNNEPQKPSEIMEKLSQLTLLLIQTNARLSTIEDILSNGVTKDNVPSSTEKKLSPREMYELSNNQNNEEDYTDINTARQKMEEIKKQKIPSIPLEDYIDEGVKLEEIFPNMPDEAYQAAYKSMDSKNNKPNSGIVF